MYVYMYTYSEDRRRFIFYVLGKWRASHICLAKRNALKSAPSKEAPTQNALDRHIQRADFAQQFNHQAATNPTGPTPDPAGQGWAKGDGDTWWPVGISCDNAPRELLDKLQCQCNKDGTNQAGKACYNGRCKCWKGLGDGKSRYCTDACDCKTCENKEPTNVMPEDMMDPPEEGTSGGGISSDVANFSSDESSEGEGDDNVRSI